MRLLLDQDVYASTGRFLSALGHDAVRAAELGLSQATDEELLLAAQNQTRVLVTRDRDYGNLVFVKGIRTGVLYLRVLPTTREAVHSELQRVLDAHSERELRQLFVVVEPGGHRIRRLSSD